MGPEGFHSNLSLRFSFFLGGGVSFCVAVFLGLGFCFCCGSTTTPVKQKQERQEKK